MKTKILIIGAGPTGIGAGYRLKESGEEDFLILEQSTYTGGLSTTFTDDKGFLWDIGGHVQFSHYPYFDKAMIDALGEDGWYHHQRESWVWMRNTFIPYPFQNNIHRLPESEMFECLKGLENRIQEPDLKNFYDWILASFGEGIAKHFLLPYNYKVWAYKPHDLNYKWVGERVSPIDLERIKENIRLQKDDVSWGPNNTFQFPKEGGTGAIWNSLANKYLSDKIQVNTQVLSIDANEKIVIDQNGKKYQYDYLLSTMPINELVKKTSSIPNDLISKTSNLLYSSTNIVGIGVEGKLSSELENKCWMYFPENNSPYYRVTVFSNYSPNNVPDSKKHISFMTETSESTVKKVDQEKLVEETIRALKEDKLLLPEHKIVSKWQFRAEYGYPTPSKERDSILSQTIPHLDKLDIYSRGRFGAWKYEVSNQDHTFMQGVEWANKILFNESEKTLVI